MGRKYKIQVDEIIKSSHMIIVELDDNVSEDDLDKRLNELEKKGYHPDDVYELNGDGVKIVEFIKDESGECKFEVPDMDKIEE